MKSKNPQLAFHNAVGNYVQKFANLEFQLRLVVAALVNNSDRRRGMIACEYATFRELLDIFESMVVLRPQGRVRAPSVERLLKELHSENKERNQIIHSRQLFHPERGEIVKWKRASRDSVRLQVDIEVKEFDDLLARTKKLELYRESLKSIFDKLTED